MEQCPHCQSEEGYYTRDYAKGATRTKYNFDGSEADNGEMHDGLVYKLGKIAFCSGCNKRIGNFEDIFNQRSE